MKFLVYPVLDSADAYGDHYHRALWYLNPLGAQIERVVFPIAEDVQSRPFPDYLDSNLKSADAEFDVITEIGPSESDLTASIAEADIILVWRVDPARPHAAIPELAGKQVIRVDHQNLQYAGSYYLMIAQQFQAVQDNALKYSQELFRTIASKVAAEKGYLFGTGPNLSQVKAFDFSDGMSIACNSMVRNSALMDRLRPPIIVIGDPIFHAGPSTYAAAFRADDGDHVDPNLPCLHRVAHTWHLMQNLDASVLEER